MKLKATLIPTLAWGFFILVLTLYPKAQSTASLPLWIVRLQPNKWVHFILFFIWYGIFYKFYWQFKNVMVATGKMDFYFLSLFTAVLIEILQNYMGWGRSADIFDILADMAGYFIAFVWFKKSKLEKNISY